MRKSKIRDNYYETLVFYIIFLIVCVAIIVTVLNHNDEISNVVFRLICVITICSALLCGIILTIKEIIVILRDYNSVKHGRYITIVGKVVGFEKNKSPETGEQINNKPIILTLDTNNKITLHVRDTVLKGKIYRFRYLYHTKIAEMVNEVEELA